ncbi:MAG: hypothetical protein JST85_21320 [Acidobacteria bacterium]|nr:hypothetical protein [Acidobacteriota bacterium]
MTKKPSDLQKEQAFHYLITARQQWERRGINYPDYLSDRDAFYKSVKQEVLPEFVKLGGDEEIFLYALRQYARQDWIKAGFSDREFDKKFNSAKRRASFKLTLGVIGSIFIILIEQLIESFLGISLTRFFEKFDENDLKGYVILFTLLFIVIIVAVAIGQLFRNRYKNYDDNEVKSVYGN